MDGPAGSRFVVVWCTSIAYIGIYSPIKKYRGSNGADWWVSTIVDLMYGVLPASLLDSVQTQSAVI